MAVFLNVAPVGGESRDAVARTTQADQVDRNGILKYGEDLQVSGPNGAIVDFASATTSASPQYNQWMNLLYDNLVRVGPDGKAQPGLATAWSFPDENTVELTLRKGVKFQDGTPFNAEAVKFSFERTLNSDVARSGGVDKSFLEIDNIEVVDDSTVRIHLKTPVQAAFFNVLHKPETYVVSPTAVRKEGDGFSKHPVGAGPYKLDAFDPQRLVSVRKWDGHWEHQNTRAWRLKGIDFEQLALGPQYVNGLRSGLVDMVRVVDSDMSAALKSDSALRVVTRASDSQLFHLDLCITDPVFKDRKVRQAIDYAIDRDEVNEAATSGAGVVATEAFPKGSEFYFPEYDRYPHDAAKAKKLLREAGVRPGYSFSVAAYPTPEFETVMVVLQQQFDRVGLKMNIKADPNFVENALINQQYPAYMTQTIRPGTGKVLSLTPGSLANFCKYENPAVTDAITVLNSTADETRQKDAWKTIVKAMSDDVLFLPLYFAPSQMGFNARRVGGVNQLLDPGEGPEFRTIYLKQHG